MSGLSPLFTWRSAIVESELPSSHRLVALVLSLHMNERGGSAFPSQRTLAAEAGLSPRQARRILGELVAAGWLTVEPRHDRSGRQTSNTYSAAVPAARLLPGGQVGG